MDVKNGNTFWADAIIYEMENVWLALKFLPGGDEDPIDCQFVKCHMVFHIKIKFCMCKAQLVTGSHITKASVTIINIS